MENQSIDVFVENILTASKLISSSKFVKLFGFNLMVLSTISIGLAVVGGAVFLAFKVFEAFDNKAKIIAVVVTGVILMALVISAIEYAIKKY